MELTENMKSARAAAKTYREAIQRNYARLDNAISEGQVSKAEHYIRVLQMLLDLLEEALEESEDDRSLGN